jgi:hypothetical protein
MSIFSVSVLLEMLKLPSFYLMTAVEAVTIR